MIIWSGFGFLGVLIPIVTWFATVFLCRTALGPVYMTTHNWPSALGLLLGAACVWLVSFKLDGPGRQLFDPATGQTVVLRRRNTLFWIPLKYVAIIEAVGALVLLFVNAAAGR